MAVTLHHKWCAQAVRFAAIQAAGSSTPRISPLSGSTLSARASPPAANLARRRSSPRSAPMIRWLPRSCGKRPDMSPSRYAFAFISVRTHLPNRVHHAEDARHGAICFGANPSQRSSDVPRGARLPQNIEPTLNPSLLAAPLKQDISTLLGLGHFYFALTGKLRVLCGAIENTSRLDNSVVGQFEIRTS